MKRRGLLAAVVGVALAAVRRRKTQDPPAVHFGGLEITLNGDLHLHGSSIVSCSFSGVGSVVLHTPSGRPGLVSNCVFRNKPKAGRACLECTNATSALGAWHGPT